MLDLQYSTMDSSVLEVSFGMTKGLRSPWTVQNPNWMPRHVQTDRYV